MFKKCVFCVAVILLSCSAGFASIGQAQSCMVVSTICIASSGPVGSGAGHSMDSIAHCQMANSHCGMIGFQYQSCAVGSQIQMSWCFCWSLCPRPCPPPCPPRPPCPPPCPPPSNPSCTARGGDATATATAISDGSAYASARAVGGDAIVTIK